MTVVTPAATYAIRYPTIAAPAVSVGELHVNATRESPTVARRFGTPALDVKRGVPYAMPLGWPTPA